MDKPKHTVKLVLAEMVVRKCVIKKTTGTVNLVEAQRQRIFSDDSIY